MTAGPCPTAADLRALLAEQLDPRDEAAFCRHLESCPACREQLDTIAGANRWPSPADRPRPPRAAESTRLREVVRRLRDSTNTSGNPGAASIEATVIAAFDQSGSPPGLGRLGEYDVLDVLGRGAMGIVFRARDTQLGRDVAIKVLSPALAADPTFRARFTREARAVAAINHTNVVTIHRIEEAGPYPYLVMEYVPGESLQRRIARLGQLDVREVVRIAAQAASGLQAAHDRGIIHRDIKPANILIDSRSGRVKLTDFGLARLDRADTLTRVGLILGTPEYMAPEQARGATVDRRGDLYSLGSVVYAMCTGRAPFAGSSSFEVIGRVIKSRPLPMAALRPNLPAGLTDIVRRLHNPDPDRRFQTAAEVVTAFRAVAADPESLRPQAAAPSTDRSRESAANRGDDESLQPGLTQVDSEPAATRPRRGFDSTRRRNRPRFVIGVVVTVVVATLLAFGMKFFRRDEPPQPLVVEPPVRPAPIRPVAVAPNAKPFAVQTGGAVPATFASLVAAVNAAVDGSTIEIRGDGPFEIPPLTLDRALRIRAAPKTHPVITLAAGAAAPGQPMVTTEASLALEGIEFRLDLAGDDNRPTCGIETRGGTLDAVNCRFWVRPGSLSQAAIRIDAEQESRFLNCEFLGGTALEWFGRSGSQLVIENCLVLGRSVIQFPFHRERGGKIELAQSTLITERLLHIGMSDRREDDRTPIAIAATGNFLHAGESFVWLSQPRTGRIDPPEVRLPRVFTWSGRNNDYVLRWFLAAQSGPGLPMRRWETLAEWNALWSQSDTDSRHVAPPAAGRIDPRDSSQFDPDQAAELVRRFAASQLPDSQTGARTNQLGPGAAYDTWRGSPAPSNWPRRAKP